MSIKSKYNRMKPFKYYKEKIRALKYVLILVFK